MAKDFYKTLGVERNSDEKAIKKAYRKLARQHHPDINPNDKSAEARFKEINEAYQVLSDSEKRGLYDQFGDDYDKVAAAGGAAGAGDWAGNVYNSGGAPGSYGGQGYGAQGVDFNEVFGRGGGASTRGGGFDPSQAGDLFESFFGGRAGRGASTRGGGFGEQARSPQRGQDIEQPVEISLGESIRGTQRSLNLTIQDPQTGARETRNVTIKIPAGVREGARVRAAGKGASGDSGAPNGDLFLRIHIAPHPFWKRDEDNLRCELPIAFSEAAIGSTVGVPAPSGELQLKIPAGTQSGTTFRLSGRGVPHLKGGGNGDIFVTAKVTVPKNLTERETELVQELAAQRDENVRAGLNAAL